MRILKVLGATAVALVCAASTQPQHAALAQGMMQQTQAAPPTVRVRGTITSIDGKTLTVKARDGAEMKVNLLDNATVNEVVKATLADVKTGAYVAVTGMPQPDGTQKALAVFIYPEAQRGLGEGHRPWDLVPNSTMTNATVDTQVGGKDSQSLTLKYKDGEQKIIVTTATEITAPTKKLAADLKPGQKILAFATKNPSDGALEARNVAFGDYGVWR